MTNTHAGRCDLKEEVERVFDPRFEFPGTLITIVGFDGSGKTTQLEALGQRFRAQGREVVETRQPTDWYRNETAVQVFHAQGGSRQRARFLALFAAADRLRHVHEVILPALARGAVVLCDRYVYATFGVFVHRGIEAEFLATINGGLPRPDLAFYLHMTTDALLQRLRERDGDDLKFEEQSPDRIESITSVYARMGNALTQVDGSLPAEAVTMQLWEHCVRHPRVRARAV